MSLRGTKQSRTMYIRYAKWSYIVRDCHALLAMTKFKKLYSALISLHNKEAAFL